VKIYHAISVPLYVSQKGKVDSSKLTLAKIELF
jgi:hypothetical protein